MQIKTTLPVVQNLRRYFAQRVSCLNPDLQNRILQCLAQTNNRLRVTREAPDNLCSFRSNIPVRMFQAVPDQRREASWIIKEDVTAVDIAPLTFGCVNMGGPIDQQDARHSSRDVAL